MKTIYSHLFICAVILLIQACQSSSESGSAYSSKYNLLEDPHDPSDRQFVASISADSLPAKLDLRNKPDHFPPVFDQGNINSCSANVVAAAIYYDMVNQSDW